MDIPHSGAIFTLGKSHLAENTQSYFYIKNDPITRLAAGPHQSAVICESGRLFVWGENHFGQLGIGGSTSASASATTHSANSSNNNSTSSNSNHTNSNSNNNNHSDIVTKPTCVKSLKTLGLKVADIAYGMNWSVILTQSNELFYCGRSIFDAEAVNVARNFSATTIGGEECNIIRKPFRLDEFDECLSKSEEAESFVSVLAGNKHFAALTSFGRLIGWGSNRNHQLGMPVSVDPVLAPHEIVLDAPVQQFACGPESTLVLTSSGSLYLTGRLNEFVFPQFTELQKNLAQGEQVIFMHISKASDIFIITSNGNIYRSIESVRNKNLIFQRFYDYDSEEHGPIWKLLKGLSFFAVLTKAHKFYTTFSESGHHLKTFREISKFKNLRLLDIAVGEQHVLVHGIPRTTPPPPTTYGPTGKHKFMSYTYTMNGQGQEQQGQGQGQGQERARSRSGHRERDGRKTPREKHSGHHKDKHKDKSKLDSAFMGVEKVAVVAAEAMRQQTIYADAQGHVTSSATASASARRPSAMALVNGGVGSPHGSGDGAGVHDNGNATPHELLSPDDDSAAHDVVQMQAEIMAVAAEAAAAAATETLTSAHDENGNDAAVVENGGPGERDDESVDAAASDAHLVTVDVHGHDMPSLEATISEVAVDGDGTTTTTTTTITTKTVTTTTTKTTSEMETETEMADEVNGGANAHTTNGNVSNDESVGEATGEAKQIIGNGAPPPLELLSEGRQMSASSVQSKATIKSAKSPTDSIRSRRSVRSIRFDGSAAVRAGAGAGVGAAAVVMGSEKHLRRPRTPYPEGSNGSTPQTVKKTPLRNYSYEAAMEQDFIEHTSPALADSLENIPESVAGEEMSPLKMVVGSVKTMLPGEEDEQLAVEISETVDALDRNKVINEIRFINNGVDVTANVRAQHAHSDELDESNDESSKDSVAEARKEAEKILDNLESELEQRVEKVRDLKADAQDSIKQTAVQVGVAVEDKLHETDEAVEAVGAKVHDAGETMQLAAQKTVTGARDTADTVGENVRRMASDARHAVGNAGSNAKQAMEHAGSSAMHAMGNVGSSAMHAMENAGTTARQAVETAGNNAKKAAGDARDAVDAAGENAKRMASDAKQAVSNAGSTAIKTAGGAGKAVGNAVENVLFKMADGTKDAVDTVASKISSGVLGAKDNLAYLLQSKSKDAAGSSTANTAEDDNSAGGAKTNTTGEEDERTTASVNSTHTSTGNPFENGEGNPFESKNPFENDVDDALERGKKTLRDNVHAASRRAEEEGEHGKGKVRQFFSSCRNEKAIRIDDEPPEYTVEDVHSKQRTGGHNKQTSTVCSIL